MIYKTLNIDYKTPLEQQIKKLDICNYLDLSKITCLFPHSAKIFDVEDGEEMKGKSPLRAEAEFNQKGRRGLCVHEGLALFRKNPKVLKNHFIDLPGSRCESAGGVPRVCLVGGGRPRLGWGCVGCSDVRWGSASCGSRALGVGSLGSLEVRVLELEKFKAKIEKVLIT